MNAAHRAATSRVAPRPPPAVERLLAERAALDLVTLAQELLLLDPRFEAAFPRERSLARAPGIEAATRRALRRDAFEPMLPAALRKQLEGLLEPTRRAATPATRWHTLADATLAAAIALAPRTAASHLVRAQKSWVMDGSRQRARDGFENARARAASPRAAAHALLHDAIAAADGGEIDRACDSLLEAARLEPASLAIAWTLAVYAAATRRERCFERQLEVVGRSRDAAAIRRRALQLDPQLRALSRLGVLSPQQSRARAEQFLSRLPPHLHFGCRS